MSRRPQAMPRRYLEEFLPEELAAEYDPWRTARPGIDYAARFSELSEKTRTERPAALDVPFGPTREETVDVFLSANDPSPVAIFLHGGYWRSNTSKEFSFVAEGLVATGMTVIVVNYALCPVVRLAEIVRQTRAAIAWTHDHIAGFGGDPGRVHLIGHSAGAHLAAMALATPWAARYRMPPDPVKSACLISGLYDLAPLPYTPVQASLQLSWEEVLECSPMWNPPGTALPVIVSYGDCESAEFRRQSRDFLHLLREAGHSAEELVQPDSDHFGAIEGFVDPASPVCRAISGLVSAQAA